MLSPSLKLGSIVKAECLALDCSLRLRDIERLRESGAGMIAASVFWLNARFAIVTERTPLWSTWLLTVLLSCFSRIYRKIVVRFNADGMQWKLTPTQREVLTFLSEVECCVTCYNVCVFNWYVYFKRETNVFYYKPLCKNKGFNMKFYWILLEWNKLYNDCGRQVLLKQSTKDAKQQTRERETITLRWLKILNKIKK